MKNLNLPSDEFIFENIHDQQIHLSPTEKLSIDDAVAWFQNNQSKLNALIKQSAKIAPQGLAFINAQIENITIGWLSDDSEEYKIYYKPKLEDAWRDLFTTSNSATIKNLSGDTEYEIRISSINQGVESEISASIFCKTLPNLDIFKYPTFINCGGATSSTIVAWEDGTKIYLNDLTAKEPPIITLNKGDVYSFPSTQFDTVTFLEGNCYICGRNGSSIAWVPVFLANNTGFTFSTYRYNPQRVAIWAVEDTVVTLDDGGDNTSIIADDSTVGNPVTLNLSANSGGILQWNQTPINTARYYHINTTGYILAYAYSNNYVDTWILMPLSKEVIVTPSGQGHLFSQGTNVNIYAQRSNGFNTTYIANGGSIVTIGNTGSQMAGDSWLFKISDTNPLEFLSSKQLADGNGSCCTSGISTAMFYKKAAITERADYIKFMAKEPITIKLYNQDGSHYLIPQITLNGTGECYEYRLTNILTPIFFEAIEGEFGAAWQPTSTGDETLIMVYDL